MVSIVHQLEYSDRGKSRYSLKIFPILYYVKVDQTKVLYTFKSKSLKMKFLPPPVAKSEDCAYNFFAEI